MNFACIKITRKNCMFFLWISFCVAFLSQSVFPYSGTPEYPRILLPNAQVVPLRTLRRRAGVGQRLTAMESDKLFRAVHVTTLAETIFGGRDKARRWLEKPQKRFDGQAPLAMLTTTPGIWVVEKSLLHVAERAQKRPD